MLCWLYFKKWNQIKWDSFQYNLLFQRKINPFNNSKKPIKGVRFFSIAYSDLRRAFECDSSHKKSQSLVKNDLFKKEYSFLGEGQKLSWGDSETTMLPKQILRLQERVVILLMSLLKKWDSAYMHIMLGGEERFFSEEYIINQFLAKEICPCEEKLVFL